MAVGLAAVSVAVGASPAGASTTIGQLAPGSSPTAYCNFSGSSDVLQPTVTAGNGYVVPSLPTIRSLVITSWSTNASMESGQELTFKVFRPLSGNTYSVVGHDGPRSITPNAVNTFSGFSLAVQPGDVIGLQHAGISAACIFDAGPGEFHLERLGDLADGQSGSFASDNQRVNATALVSPANAFTITSVKRNARKGTATMTLHVPNPGELTATGTGVKAAATGVISKHIDIPGTVTLVIRAKGKKRNKLHRTGKVKLTPTITYTPTGGNPSTQATKLKLKKR